ncbi:SDR family oxidoreductase [Dinghuibacter silviterrae]|uniref:NAD(P)-dependent dehydrogenase (Short-subunit alcohol dehydrogenase family) n=1 Tax=Dinghuibacter silviterrae TaxID=1539049 RepID=A0A4R8DW33_9BACT|nr:SDR family oxidoreductase [Dinghuibacter silviterrae]TDX02148.1 NAD(P)-dependent dehydrogenase (short-subunit alcohol dehydrogenase family) [Dinghuibacter silviterrae]
MKTALITGANKSIGLETARQLLQQGFQVYLGSRDLDKGREAAAQLKAQGLQHVEAIQLDVSDDDSVRAARTTIGAKTTALDVLINNAGINGGMPQSPISAGMDQFKKVFETNYFGVIRVVQAFFGLLRESPQPRIVMVSSSAGSLTLQSDPTWKYYQHKGAVYHPSKSALNMYTIDLAFELLGTSFKVNAVDPGFIKTDFNGHRGTGSVEEAAKRIIKYALIGPEGPTGKFFSEETNPETGEIPW